MWAFDELSPLPVIRVSEDGEILAANPAAVRAFGPGAAPGSPIREVLGVFQEIDLQECVRDRSPIAFCASVAKESFKFWGIPDPDGGFVQVYAVDIPQSDRREEHHLVADLQQRMKELSCYHGLAEAVRTRLTVVEICQDLAALIPPAWRYPALGRGRVMLDGVAYVSEPFQITPWGQSAAIIASGVARGMVQVFYTEDPRIDPGDDIFLSAERRLLDTLARTLGEAIQRREAETEIRVKTVTLAQERNRFETILRSIGEGVVVTDATDHVLLMNPAAIQLLGIEDREPIGEDFLLLLRDDAFVQVWRKTAQRGIDFAKQDLKAGGSAERTLWVTRSRIPDLHRGQVGHVSILHDVTREREISRMKSDFVSSVSHELRTPMTSIKGFARTLLDRPGLDEAQRGKFLAIIDDQADRMIALIEELLVIARIESGHIVAERIPVDIPKLLARVVLALEVEALKKNILLRYTVTGELAKPLGDPEKIHIVLFNLAENAVKFCPPGGQVTMRAHSTVDWAVIRVEDTGIGIPQQEHGKIFDRFYRVHRPGAQDPGTGLGLYIVKEMLRLHGGQIDVESEVGSGTTFTVRLPLGTVQGATTAAAESVLEEDSNG
ncbi:MAG: PAS domain-containing protein [Candidatus Hydrogenedentes bacterium]|nr:PAS domain-containing protein [Candidatus Hydrogenedentota bacterium]